MTRTQTILDDLADWYSLPVTSTPVWRGFSAPRSRYGRPQFRPESAGRRALVRIVEAVLAWHDRARQRRTLMELSDHMLRDIGLSRADALGEAAKPFWRI
jgi:uncharacterized protein YjiS (DUF1127 family)